VNPPVQLREAPHAAQDALGQVACATDRRANAIATVLVIDMGIGEPQPATADVTTTALRPQHPAQ
jgi:hypothetical protein